MISQELQKKIVQVMQDGKNSHRLIGDYSFDEEELNEIKQYLLGKIKANREFKVPNDYAAFIVFLVIKLRGYKQQWIGKKFWERIASDVFEDDSLKSFVINSSFYNGLDSTFSRYNRILFKTKGDKRAFAQTFFFEARAPKESRTALIQLLWNLYVSDLRNWDYSVSSISFCRDIVQSLAKSYLNDNYDSDNDIEFNGAFYKIRAGLKYGFCQNTEKSAYLIDKIFKSIYFFDKNHAPLDDTYLSKFVSKIIRKCKEVTFSERKNPQSVRKNPCNVYSIDDYVPKFQFKEPDRIFVVFPQWNITDRSSQFKQACISVYQDFDDRSSTVLTFEEVDLKKTNGFLKLPSVQIDVSKRIDKAKKRFDLSASIQFDGSKRQNITRNLSTSYLLFKEGKMITNAVKPNETYILVVPNDFDINQNLYMKQGSESYIKIGVNIFKFTPSEGDAINFDNKVIRFSSVKKSSSVGFWNNDSLIDNRVIIKNQNEFPIYTKGNDIFVIHENPKRERHFPNRLIISKFSINPDNYPSDLSGSKEQELTSVSGNQYRASCSQFCLDTQGFHEFQVNRYGGEHARSIDFFPYVIDSTAHVSKNQICFKFGSSEIEYTLFGQTRHVTVQPEDKEEIIACGDYSVRVIPYYFHWKFSSAEDNYHYMEYSSENEKPFFPDQLAPAGNLHTIKLCIDSNLDIRSVFAKGLNGSGKQLIAFDGDKKIAEIGRFLANKESLELNYTFDIYAEVKDGVRKNFHLTRITNVPYYSDNIGLDDCFTLVSGKLRIDFRGWFFHSPNKDYKIHLQIKENNTPKTVIFDNNQLNPDESEEFECNLSNGDYLVSVSYFSSDDEFDSFFSDAPKEIALVIDKEILIGDEEVLRFAEQKSVSLTKAIGESNVKLKGVELQDIRFVYYSDDKEAVYFAKLCQPKQKKSCVCFRVKPSDSDLIIIRDRCYASKTGEETNLLVYADQNGRCLTKQKPEENSNSKQISSIYVK